MSDHDARDRTDSVDGALDDWQERHDQALAAYSEAVGRHGPDLRIPEPSLPPEWLDRFRENAALIREFQAAIREDDDHDGDRDAEFPARLGQYVILRKLGEGGMGVVFGAIDTDLDRPVALKLPRSSRSGVPIPDFGRFHREIRAAAQLNHPGIVPVFASGVDEHGRPYYAMREVAGRTLKEAIIAFHASDRTGRRDPGERTLNFRALLNSFGSVCNTLAYAHSRGVLHRDLKPANIILGQYGETVVLDWGLVKRTEGLDESAVPFDGHPDTGDGGGAERTPSGLPHGTPEFMSPEQASGRIDDLGPATDIYSLGATLYTILTGVPPFQGSSLEVTLQRVRSGNFPAPGKVKKGVARPLEAICLKAMSLSPADRYRSATDLARDVDHWLADERVSADREPPWAPAWRWIRKHGTISAAIIAAIVLGTISLGVLLRRERLHAAELAEANRETNRWLDQTIDSIEDYYTGVSADFLLGQTEFRELRERLLERPRLFYEGVTVELERRPMRDDRARSLLVKGRLGLARISANLGRSDDARLQVERALPTIDALRTAEPANPSYLQMVVSLYSTLGGVQREVGDFRGAAETLGKAIAMSRSLVASHPEVPGYRRQLAGDYTSLGNVQRDTGNLAAAAESHRRAIAEANDLVSAKPDVPDYTDTLATAYMNLGNAERETGDLRAATRSLSRSVALRTGLISAHPDISPHQYRYAGSQISLASLKSATGDREGAKASLGEAIKALDALASNQPNVLAFRERLAMADNNLGNLLFGLGDHKGALESFGQSIAIYAKLKSDRPHVPKFASGLARAYNNRAEAQFASGDLSGAAESSRQGIAVYSVLTAKQPGVPEYQDGLGAAYYILSSVQHGNRAVRDAIESCRKCVEIYNELSHKNPKVLQYQHRLAGAYENLAEVRRDSGDLDGAEEAYVQAIEPARRAFDRAPTVMIYRTTLSSCLQGLASVERRRDHPSKAASIIRERVALWPKEASELYRAAGEFALCVPSSTERSTGGDRDRERQLRDEAMACLHQAIAAGWDDLKHAASDPDLKSLAGRRDFQELVLDPLFPSEVFQGEQGTH
jgi:eukaryotic-like serine/threonine-protein kinase